MARSRRTYTREFKIEAVRRVLEDGIPQTHVAKELGVSANTIWAWKREVLADSVSSKLGRHLSFRSSLLRLRPGDEVEYNS